MCDTSFLPIAVRATLDDAYDGVVRLMGDAQRFGFLLRAVSLEARSDDAVADLRLLVPEGADLDGIAARFGRHPGVRDVGCAPEPGACIGPAPLAAECAR